MIAQHGILEISAGRLRANVELFRQRLPKSTMVCAMVKADAYGHGLAQIVPLLLPAGVEWAGVYTLDEALAAAQLAPELRVLAVAPLVITEESPMPEATLRALVAARVRICLTDLGSAERLARMLGGLGRPEPVCVHVQVDTGLTRGGADAVTAGALIAALDGYSTLKLEGVFAHLSHGDVPGHQTVTQQLEGLHAVADPVKRRRPDVLVHLQNTGGAWHLSDPTLDMIRLGISLYGLQPSYVYPIAGLQPIARVTAPILNIHESSAGVGVGYSHTFVTSRPSRLAIVPVGYTEGYPRALSNRGVVQVRGVNVPVVGRVNMDQIIVDVTEVVGAVLGDEVTVFSHERADPNSVDSIAEAGGLIPHEVTTGFGPRLVRRVVE